MLHGIPPLTTYFFRLFEESIWVVSINTDDQSLTSTQRRNDFAECDKYVSIAQEVSAILRRRGTTALSVQ